MVEMEVEHPQGQSLAEGASSSSGPVVPVQEAAPVASPSSHEVRMDVTESSGITRPLEADDGENSNKRARILAGMLLFDENDTSDWQDAVWEAQLTGARSEPHELEIVIDHNAQPYTDVPGVRRCQVEPRSDLYGDRTGKLLNPEKVIKGRLTELKHMNDHHVYDWIDEADIPKGTKVETSRWLDDLKPRDGDEDHVRSRIVVQQYSFDKRLDVHQGTPPLKVLRLLLALATSKDAHRRKVCGIWDVSVAFFHSPMDEFTVVRPPVELRVRGKLWVLNRALYGTRMASRCFGKLVGEVLKDAQFGTITIVPNTYHHPQRDIDTVVHGDDFVAVAEDEHLDYFERVLENSMEIKRVGRTGPGRSSAGKVLKRVVSWTGDGFTWEADPKLLEKLLTLLNMTGGKGATVPGAKDIGKDDRDVNSELQDAEAKIVQAAAGLEQYIALDRPDIAYSVKTALQQMSKPTKLMMLRVIKVARYLKSNPRLVWKFQYQQQPKSIDVYVAADFAARETMLRSTSGIAEFYGRSPIEFGSSSQSVRALSTGESEFYAITKGSAHSLHSQAMLKGFGVTAEAGIGIASRQGRGRLKHLEVKWLWVKEKVSQKALRLCKHPTETNIADLATKYLSKHRMEMLLEAGNLVLIKEGEEKLSTS